jgi:hypothetical protein
MKMAVADDFYQQQPHCFHLSLSSRVNPRKGWGRRRAWYNLIVFRGPEITIRNYRKQACFTKESVHHWKATDNSKDQLEQSPSSIRLTHKHIVFVTLEYGVSSNLIMHIHQVDLYWTHYLWLAFCKSVMLYLHIPASLSICNICFMVIYITLYGFSKAA